MSMRVVVGGVVGLVTAYVAGILVLQWVGTTFGDATGWEDLVAVVMSAFSFAPVGALTGAAVMWRRGDGRSLWASMSGRRRTLVIVAIAVGVAAAVVYGIARDESMSAVFLAVWALPVGAVVGYLAGGIGVSSA